MSIKNLLCETDKRPETFLKHNCISHRLFARGMSVAMELWKVQVRDNRTSQGNLLISCLLSCLRVSHAFTNTFITLYRTKEGILSSLFAK